MLSQNLTFQIIAFNFEFPKEFDEIEASRAEKLRQDIFLKIELKLKEF
jgi:hypothetical protein